MAVAPLRIGILGAANIAPMALIRPASRLMPETTVLAVAARDPERAQRFATRHGIPRVHSTYDALLADPDVDAVYNPLPNSLHKLWTIRALEAGKHVLCEKPFAANAAEAQEMADAAARTGKVLVEAFHYRYHPLFARMRAILDAGELGTVEHFEVNFVIPLLRAQDIRWRKDLAGGGLMDTGCYTVSLLRHLAGAEPRVLRADARWTKGGVDRWLGTDLRFDDGRTARLTCGLLAASFLRITAKVRGSHGSLWVLNPILPHFYHRLRVVTPAGTRTERVAGQASYDHQLRAFVAAVRQGTRVPTDPADAVANMRVIDAIYTAAGRPV
jgi:predicted dehydrogenase